RFHARSRQRAQRRARDLPAGTLRRAHRGLGRGGSGRRAPSQPRTHRARAPAGARMTVDTRAVPHGGEAILQPLNERQRAAVTHGAGPLLIVAGAGTGKTHVITSRIAWLIAEKRARPEEILALTFTEKAAAEMESRVDVLVPYGYTGATISTFHAFGDRLV